MPRFRRGGSDSDTQARPSWREAAEAEAAEELRRAAEPLGVAPPPPAGPAGGPDAAPPLPIPADEPGAAAVTGDEPARPEGNPPPASRGARAGSPPPGTRRVRKVPPAAAAARPSTRASGGAGPASGPRRSRPAQT